MTEVHPKNSRLLEASATSFGWPSFSADWTMLSEVMWKPQYSSQSPLRMMARRRGMASAPATLHLAPVRSRRSLTGLRQVPSMTPLATLENDEGQRRTMRGFKIANGASIGVPLRKAREQVARLLAQRNALPERVPVGSIKGSAVRLPARRKHLSDALKMLAYQAESDLFAQVAPGYARSLDEGRSVIRAALRSAADIEVGPSELRVTLVEQSSPRRSRALARLCQILNDTDTRFPGTNLRLRYAVRQPAEA